jgi:hypothetical protein
LQPLAAALWLLGLGYAGGVFRSNTRPSFAGRLRDALVLGVAIPSVLALVHALYPATCWLALAAVCAAAYVRRPSYPSTPEREPVPYV